MNEAEEYVEQDVEEHQEAPEAEEATEGSEAPPQKEWSNDDEDNARLFGWKPSTEWQGEKPAGYIEDPREWLQRVERSPVFRTMQEKLDRQEQESAENARRLKAMNERALEIQRDQHNKELQRIAQGKRAAVMDADQEAYDRLDREEADIRKQAQQPQQREQQGPDPWVTKYAKSEEGAWINNPILRKEGSEAIEYMPNKEQATPQQQIEYAEQMLREAGRLPKKEEPKPRRNMVDPGGLAGGGGKMADSFSKLPSDAKQQFASFVKEGLFKDTKEDREEYANEYNAV